MRARPSPRSGCSPRSGSTTSTPAPTWSTSTWDGCGRSSARMRPGRCAARGTRSRVAGGDRGRLDWPLRQLGWLEVAWVGFAVANLGGMWLVPTWETVPFHFIWISLTVVYGFRVWDLERTGWVLAAVVSSTGALLMLEVSKSFQPPDELTEVPLMAAVFLAMVWHARRRVVAMERERASSEANRRLLEGQRRFVQDASHELRTPITIAMGHADLLAREIRDPELAEDAGIVVDELLRLRRLADRLLLLASSADPDFLTTSPTEVHPLLAEARARWAPSERRFVVERGNAAVALADPERLGTAPDARVAGWRSGSPTPALASRRSSSRRSSTASPGWTWGAAATMAASAWAWRSSRRSPRRTAGRSGSAARWAAAASSRSSCPPRWRRWRRRPGDQRPHRLDLRPDGGRGARCRRCAVPAGGAAGAAPRPQARQPRRLFHRRAGGDLDRAPVADRQLRGHAAVGPHGPAPAAHHDRRAAARAGGASHAAAARRHSGGPAALGAAAAAQPAGAAAHRPGGELGAVRSGVVGEPLLAPVRGGRSLDRRPRPRAYALHRLRGAVLVASRRPRPEPEAPLAPGAAALPVPGHAAGELPRPRHVGHQPGAVPELPGRAGGRGPGRPAPCRHDHGVGWHARHGPGARAGRARLARA